MTKRGVLIYTNKDEPLTNLLLAHQSELNLQPLFVKDLLDENFEIFDSINAEKTAIEWFSPILGTVRNCDDYYIINRCNYIPLDWFSDFKKEDQEYAKNELWAYLVFALSAFPQITEKPGPGGLSGGCFPLTQQWKDIKTIFSCQLTTPKYFIGPLELMPSSWNQKAIFTEPYHFYHWKETEYEGNQKESVFCIQKPPGTPVLISIVGDNIEFCYQDEAKSVGKHIESQLSAMASQIARFYHYFVSEMLFFCEKEQVTFGMAYNIPISTSYMPSFKERVLKNLELTYGIQS